jgi:hypothetical protein
MGFATNQSVRRTKAEQLVGVTFTGSPRKVAHNTVEYTREDGTRVIRFHLTDIVEYKPDGSIMLNSGGFKTFTTKARLNQYLPAGWEIWAERGLWYVGKAGHWSDKDSPRYVFCDGLTFHPDGSVSGADPDAGKRAKLLAKQIRKFCQAMADLPELPKPEPGDCFLCQMEINGEHEAGSDHLESHISDDEMYFVGSMIIRAMAWAGCTGFVINAAFSNNGYQKQFRDHAVRATRRYLRARLGLSR